MGWNDAVEAMKKEDNMTEIKHPDNFKTGYRILMLTLRNTDGGKVDNPDRVSKKLISSGVHEFDEIYAKLLALRKGEERIYCTIDERDIDKAIMIFKHRQLDADYVDEKSRDSFYVDIWNRWISSLQSPRARKGTLFLVDIDEKDGGQNVGLYESIKAEIQEKGIEIVHEYKTKNGIHIITKPFNPSTVTFFVQKNAMMLLTY